MISKKLIWITLGDGEEPDTVLWAFPFLSFFPRALMKFWKSPYKCLGPLSSYITNSLPFKFFPNHTPFCLMVPFFSSSLQCLQSIISANESPAHYWAPLVLQCWGTHCDFKRPPSRRQTNWRHLFRNRWTLYLSLNNIGPNSLPPQLSYFMPFQVFSIQQHL